MRRCDDAIHQTCGNISNSPAPEISKSIQVPVPRPPQVREDLPAIRLKGAIFGRATQDELDAAEQILRAPMDDGMGYDGFHLVVDDFGIMWKKMKTNEGT